jgi:polyferredoxin
LSALGNAATRRVADGSGRFAGLRWKVQLASFLLLNALAAKSWRPYRLKGVCVPVLNCHGCPAASAYCPVGVVADMFSLRLVPWLALGAFGLVGVLFGRLTCGWVCPFGFLQDLVAKIPVPKWKPPRWARFIKYAVLVGMVLLAPLAAGQAPAADDQPLDLNELLRQAEEAEGAGLPEPAAAVPPAESPPGEGRGFNWLFCSVCPDSTIMAGGYYWIFDESHLPIPVRRIVFLGLFLLLSLFVVRGFCRVVCPIGAGLAPFNRLSPLSLRRDRDSCTECMRCVRDCPTGTGPVADPRSPECIRCGDCCECPSLRMGFSDEDG